MRPFATVAASAALVTWLATFAWRRFAGRRPSLVVAPDERRLHARPTPTGGGVAMFVGLVAGLAVARSLGRFSDAFQGSEPIGVLLGATVIAATGLVDDVRKMSAPAKLAGQVLAGSLMASQGVQMLYFRVPFWDVLVLDQGTGFVITVVWVVLVSNAVNLIDGLDGLAAGIVAIAGLGFLVYSTQQVEAGLLSESSIGPLVAAIAVGVCAGFLPHNVHPARIFMGDAGALFLGLLLATSTLVVGGRTADDFSGQTFFFFAPVLIPFVILGVPLLDTALAFGRRVLRRRAFHVADREHLHYRLERIGHGHRRAVTILWAWTAVLALLVVAPTFQQQASLNVLVLPGILALGVGLYTVLHPQVRAAAREADVEEQLVLEATGEVPVVRPTPLPGSVPAPAAQVGGATTSSAVHGKASSTS